MYNPFPGMNPYLEQPALWHQVHNRLIVAIADTLTPQIAPNYHASIEERVYTSFDDALLVGIADVAVTRRNTQSSHGTTVTTSKPRPVQVPMPEEVIERFLEVRLTTTGEVVCIVEVLSPKNKRAGEGRTAYETKRAKILASQTSLVEIDLLRSGDSMPIIGAENGVYSVLVSRGYERPQADLYAFDLRESLPTITVPLRKGDVEPTLNLQSALDDVCDRARFDLVIDYTQPLKPALSDEDTAWVQQIIDRFEHSR